MRHETATENEANAQKETHEDQDTQNYQNSLENHDDQSNILNSHNELEYQSNTQKSYTDTDDNNVYNDEQTNTESSVSYDTDDDSKFDVRLESFNKTKNDPSNSEPYNINSLANDTDPDIDYSNYDNEDSENESVTGMS